MKEDFSKRICEILKTSGAFVLYAGVCFFIGMVYFDNVIFALAAVPFSLYFLKKYKLKRKKKSEKLMLERFRLFISYLNAGMQGASKPLERAFSEAIEEMKCVFSERDLFLSKMIKIQKSLENNNNKKLENEFFVFAQSTGLKDIIDFANVLVSCKNTNTASISDVISLTDELIGEKMGAQMDFDVVVSENRMIFNIMCLMPIFFIVFFNYCMTDYLAVLYEGKGRIVMVLGAVFNALCYVMGNTFLERNDK